MHTKIVYSFTLHIAFYIQFICPYDLNKFQLNICSIKHFLSSFVCRPCYWVQEKSNIFWNERKSRFEWKKFLMGISSHMKLIFALHQNENSQKDIFMRRERQIQRWWFCRDGQTSKIMHMLIVNQQKNLFIS